jgi:predicted transcriptional regulator
MTKDTSTAAIREMPQEFDVDELIERLLFIEKVEEGLKQIDNGQKIPLDEVKKIVSEWRK